MTPHPENRRIPDFDVNAQFYTRHSPRAFDGSLLSDEETGVLFEAARFAPSCFNEQPWIFCYARTPDERERFLNALSEKNRSWGSRAGLLLFVLARKTFERNGKENRLAAFDAGAAWMSLALQARHLGLFAHAMAGYDMQKALAAINADPEKMQVLAAVAVGRLADPSVLAPDMQDGERPNTRHQQSKFVFRGMVS